VIAAWHDRAGNADAFCKYAGPDFGDRKLAGIDLGVVQSYEGVIVMPGIRCGLLGANRNEKGRSHAKADRQRIGSYHCKYPAASVALALLPNIFGCVQAHALREEAHAIRPRPWGRSGAGRFEQREARQRGRRLLLAETRRPRNKISRRHCRRHNLNRDVREAMAAVTRQLRFWSVRRRAMVNICQHGRIVGYSKRHPTVGAVYE
jgi:hypothetical protein